LTKLLRALEAEVWVSASGKVPNTPGFKKMKKLWKCIEYNARNENYFKNVPVSWML
jgi:hypothetical protein